VDNLTKRALIKGAKAIISNIENGFYVGVFWRMCGDGV
jgi:hypothetical protein